MSRVRLLLGRLEETASRAVCAAVVLLPVYRHVRQARAQIDKRLATWFTTPAGHAHALGPDIV